MSASLSVLSERPIDIRIPDFIAKTNDIFNLLLNQPENARLDLKFIDGQTILHDWLRPDGRVVGFIESKFLAYGAVIIYGLDKYWETYSQTPRYRFTVAEMPSQDCDLLMVCLSMMVVVAGLFSQDTIIDYGGLLLARGDYVPIEKLRQLAISVKLPLYEAVRCFCGQLPLQEGIESGRTGQV